MFELRHILKCGLKGVRVVIQISVWFQVLQTAATINLVPFTRRGEILGTRLCHDFFLNFLCCGVSSDLETKKMKFQPISKIFKQKICQIYIYNVLTALVLEL